MNSEARMAGQVSFQLTEEDCAAAHRDWLRDRFDGSGGAPYGHRVSAIMLPVLVIAWVGSMTVSALRPLPGFLRYLLPIAIILSASIWLLRGYAVLDASRSARRTFRQRAAYRRPLTYGWSEEGLSFETEHGSGRIPWGDLYRWYAAEHSFLFFADQNLFYFIPRSALSDAQAKDLEATVVASGAPHPPRLEDRLIYA
jgi:hypothetical protein